MPEANKRAVLALCTAHGVPIIEDDIYAEMGANTAHAQPIKAFDEVGQVIYCSSFSKLLSPGMRVGWMNAGRWQARVEMLKYSQSRFPDELSQIVMASFVGSSAYDRHVRRLQQALRARRQALGDCLARHFGPSIKVNLPEGGLFLWVELPSGVSAMTLGHAALSHGLLTSPGPLFSGQPRMDRFMRLSAGMHTAEEMDEAMALLAELSRKQQGVATPQQALPASHVVINP